MNNPQISVIVPVYNVELYLEKCIKSILCQDFTDYELILIDDGSTDASAVICDDFSHKENKIKVYHQENKGVGTARNVGLDKASGRYVMFADADDYFLPNAFSCLYELIAKNDSDLALANSLVKDETNEYKLFAFKKTQSQTLFKDIEHFALWGYIFKSSIINNYKIRFVDGLAYSEDRLFLNKLMLFAKKINFSNSECYVHRINPTSACASKDLIRKAHHQFFASSEICKLQDLTSCLKEKKYFSYNSHRIIKNAVFDLVRASYPNEKMQLVYAEYKSFFPKFALINFLRIYIPLYLIHNFKKVIKNVLSHH